MLLAATLATIIHSHKQRYSVHAVSVTKSLQDLKVCLDLFTLSVSQSELSFESMSAPVHALQDTQGPVEAAMLTQPIGSTAAPLASPGAQAWGAHPSHTAL